MDGWCGMMHLTIRGDGRARNLLSRGWQEWGGKVVYGDTDSLFVEFKGKSRAEAWRLGREIAAAVSPQSKIIY